MKPISERATTLVVLLATLFVVTLSASSTTAQPSRGLQVGPVKSLPAATKRYAIVVGVDQYADTQITTLGGASNDAKALASALVQYAGFPSEQVTLLKPACRSAA